MIYFRQTPTSFVQGLLQREKMLGLCRHASEVEQILSCTTSCEAAAKRIVAKDA